jgi:hypothetical protein
MMLTASLALTGHEEEARETLRRYLALPVDKAKTIAEIKAHQPFDSPFLRDYYDRVYQGLLKAGLPEL